MIQAKRWKSRLNDYNVDDDETRFIHAPKTLNLFSISAVAQHVGGSVHETFYHLNKIYNDDVRWPHRLHASPKWARHSLGCRSLQIFIAIYTHITVEIVPHIEHFSIGSNHPICFRLHSGECKCTENHMIIMPRIVSEKLSIANQMSENWPAYRTRIVVVNWILGKVLRAFICSVVSILWINLHPSVFNFPHQIWEREEKTCHFLDTFLFTLRSYWHGYLTAGYKILTKACSVRRNIMSDTMWIHRMCHTAIMLCFIE